MPVQLPSLQSMLKRNVPEPSTKNGRRSGKNVSNASRFTTAGIGFDLAEVRIGRRRQRQARA